MSHLNPKIYVACLASHNAGNPHGDWIDANQDVDAIFDSIHKILATSPIKGAEEWKIRDDEDFGGISISPHESLQSVVEIAAFVTKHGELGVELYNHINGGIEEAKQVLEECYRGTYKSRADFVRSFTEETNSIPDSLAYYIDYKRMAKDWFISDFFSVTDKNEIHVFSSY